MSDDGMLIMPIHRQSPIKSVLLDAESGFTLPYPYPSRGTIEPRDCYIICALTPRGRGYWWILRITIDRYAPS